MSPSGCLVGVPATGPLCPIVQDRAGRYAALVMEFAARHPYGGDPPCFALNAHRRCARCVGMALLPPAPTHCTYSQRSGRARIESHIDSLLVRPNQ